MNDDDGDDDGGSGGGGGGGGGDDVDEGDEEGVGCHRHYTIVVSCIGPVCS